MAVNFSNLKKETGTGSTEGPKQGETKQAKVKDKENSKGSKRKTGTPHKAIS